MSIITLFLSTSTNCWGESGLDGKPLERWGYALIESVKSNIERKYLEIAVQSLNVLSITGYKVGRDGQLHAPSAEQQRAIASLAGRSALKILPLVTLTSSSEGRKLLASESCRQRAIGNLAALAQDGLYTGLHLDFEYLPPEDAPKLATFLKELRSKLNGKKLTMAVFPPVDFPEKWSGFHNLDLIGPHLDEIVLMCYDYHRPGTVAGPVVDFEWAKRNIVQVLKSIRPEKVWLGMPAYGYDWPKNGKPKVVSARQGVKLGAKFGAVRHLSGTLYFQYSDHTGLHDVYVADLETRKRMEDLARSFELRGVATWRLGFEELAGSNS